MPPWPLLHWLLPHRRMQGSRISIHNAYNQGHIHLTYGLWLSKTVRQWLFLCRLETRRKPSTAHVRKTHRHTRMNAYTPARKHTHTHTHTHTRIHAHMHTRTHPPHARLPYPITIASVPSSSVYETHLWPCTPHTFVCLTKGFVYKLGVPIWQWSLLYSKKYKIRDTR